MSENGFQITAKLLIDCGYNHHQFQDLIGYASDLYQKKISDSRGVRYFIEYYRYPPQAGLREEWAAKVQFQNTVFGTLNIESLDARSMSPLMVEEMFDRAWRSFESYYELYEKAGESCPTEQ